MSTSPRILTALCVVLASGLASCELLGDTSLPDYAKIQDISYVQHVQVLFQDRCTVCHQAAGSLPDLTSRSGLAAGAASGGVVVPFSADRSRMIRMLSTRVGGVHPAEVGGDTLSAVEVDFLRRWIDGGARDDSGEPLYPGRGAAVLATIPDEALIAVIDTEHLAIARYIDLAALGFSSDSRPTELAAAPDGGSWLLSLPGERAVLQFDAANTLIGLAEIQRPGPLAVSQDGAWFVVGREAGDNADRIEVVEASDMRITPFQTAFQQMAAVAMRPQGDVAFAASRQADQLAVLPTGGGATTFVGIGGPRHDVGRMLTPPGGSRLIAVGSQSGQAVLFDLQNPLMPREIGSVAFGQSLRGAALMSQRLVVLTTSGSVLQAEAEAGSAVQSLAAVPSASSLTTSGGFVVVGHLEDGSGQRFTDLTVRGGLSVIDAQSGAVLRTIQIDGLPFALTDRPAATPPSSARR